MLYCLLSDFVAVVACLMVVTGLLHDSVDRRRWIWYAFYTGIVLAVLWLYYMLRYVNFSQKHVSNFLCLFKSCLEIYNQKFAIRVDKSQELIF